MVTTSRHACGLACYRAHLAVGDVQRDGDGVNVAATCQIAAEVAAAEGIASRACWVILLVNI